MLELELHLSLISHQVATKNLAYKSRQEIKFTPLVKPLIKDKWTHPFGTWRGLMLLDTLLWES